MDLDDLPPVRAFGTWDAPITDGAEWIDVPTELACFKCGEQFAEGDNGAIMPSGFAEHRECGLRGVQGGIGHFVDHARYCRSELGTDAGLSRRASSWLVWRLIVERRLVTEETLERLRDGTMRLCYRCGWTSTNPGDLEYGYCGECKDYTHGFPDTRTS